MYALLFYGGVWFQNPSTYICSNIVVFFNYLCLLIFIIRGLVGFWMYKTMVIKTGYRRFLDHEYLEIWWTCVPVIVMFLIGVPSIRILYMWDCQPGTRLGLKVVGHQWYWRYEYRRINVMFDSFPINLDSLRLGQMRIMDVDIRAVLPGEVPVRVIITARDVLHRWAVPALGVKVDCIPGRVNRIRMRLPVSGVYYGQCSELCGVGHSIIPIVVEVVNVNAFLKWVDSFRS